MLFLNRLHIKNSFVTILMNTKKTTATLAVFAIVTAVALVTASSLATPVVALKGATTKTVSSKTPTKATSSFTKFISCIKTTHKGLTIDQVNSCYDRGYTGSRGVSTTAAAGHGTSSIGASSLIPLVGLPTLSSGSGHTPHHVASHTHHAGVTHSPV